MLRNTLLAGAALALALPLAAEAKPARTAAAAAPTADSATVSGLGARNIGSATMSGRIAALAARQEANGKVTLFVGAASGGIWKSEDGGTTFKPVFDKQPVQSIGALALDPTNPQVIWAGTGESWTRNSVSVGDGVYRSVDGGETWTKMGLPKTERITRILVHPRDGNTVYVCAPGALWSDSPDRGLYKTTDGGATWTQIVKAPNLSTGCSTIAMDPANPENLIVGMWDFRRKGWTFRSGGNGPDAPSGSAMMRSSDGGRTWNAMTSDTVKGLPKGPWGRIEVVYAPSNNKQIYAFVEGVRSALYVSEDGGQSFEERDRSQGMVWRPFYFGRMEVDPNNDKRVFKMGFSVIASDDGGKSFANAAGGSHGDWHDVWINPKNSQHIIGADDGGLWITHDGGAKWRHAENLPISQFYHVSTDDKDPYQVYGGLQDNSSWVGDSAYPGGITNSRWENLYGGDGFWAFADPADPNFAYAEYQGGNLSRIDRRTLQARFIQPLAGYKEKLRYNWNAPVHMSPNEKGTIYIGAQFLFRSRDHGGTWERISPDLSTNNPEKQKQEESGGITVDNSAAEMHTTIYSISESPKNGQVIWVGTDDGNVQLTQDGARTWTNVTRNIKGLPKENWISWVEASRHDPATAFVAVDRHTFGDMGPYVYKTTDYGRTWRPLITPQTPGVRGYAHVVREDSRNPNLLFVGTEFGMWASIDSGRTWAQFKPGDFPAVAVRDMVVQPRDGDLVLATHGRGIWIVDDLTPLRSVTPEMLTKTAVLLPGREVQQRIQGNGGWAEGDAKFAGSNPADGAVINYYQKARHVIGRMKLEIIDEQGKVVDTLPATKRKGINRVVWSMRVKAPQVPPAASIAGAATQGVRVPPGRYTVRLTKAGEVMTQPLVITLDRRATYTVEERRAQYEAGVRVSNLFNRMSMLIAKVGALKAQTEQRIAALPAGDPERAKAQAFLARVEAVRGQVVATKEGGAITGEERLREHMDSVYGAITSVESAPTNYQLARVDALERELGEVEASFNQLAATKVAGLGFDLSRVEVAQDDARGGPVSALAAGLVGLRYYGSFDTLAMRGERD
ncbi:MAG TPA: hypothetical protein VF559_11315 [Caulobacteraceae bacterium]|jgi:photosystem II stability/assembly factor-like uncharacterized protein